MTTEILAGLPAAQVRVIEEAETIDIVDIQYGVVFVHAEWSIQSFGSLRNVVRVIQYINEFRLYLASTDFKATLAFAQEVGQIELRGSGEAFWIRQGRVLKCSNSLDRMSTYEVAESVRMHILN